jgi:hypothetical protein
MGNPTGDSTITNLPAALTLQGTEVVAVDQLQNGILVTVKVPLNTVIEQIVPSAFGIAMLAWFNSLPKTLPATAGVLWNNGGTLAQS